MHEKKTWREKLRGSKDLPRVEEIPQKMRKVWELRVEERAGVVAKALSPAPYSTLPRPLPPEVSRLARGTK